MRDGDADWVAITFARSASKLLHEGRPVFKGTKYAMRSDLIYEADETIERVG